MENQAAASPSPHPLFRARPSVFADRVLVLGSSEVFLRSIWEMFVVSAYNVTVLIEGESGTGKELIGRAIHELSPRRKKPFIAVNCAALPRELAENELFGHVQGAFTGATRKQSGLVEHADGGTLFLDEISSLDPFLQAKLLRFLDSGEFRRIGGRGNHVVDVRVIAAANTDLQAQIASGNFRGDLYFRLATYPIHLPPLRQRREDIATLAEFFAQEAADRLRVDRPAFSKEAIESLQRHDWPGNVRELRNVLTQLTLHYPGKRIRPEDLPFTSGPVDAFHSPSPVTEGEDDELSRQGTFQELKSQVVAKFERRYLLSLIRRHQGNVTQAARSAGKHRRALAELLKKHSLSPDDFRPSNRGARRRDKNLPL